LPFISVRSVPPLPSPYLKGALPNVQVDASNPVVVHKVLGSDGSDKPSKYDHSSFRLISICDEILMQDSRNIKMAIFLFRVRMEVALLVRRIWKFENWEKGKAERLSKLQRFFGFFMKI
jgi:hypothetical protein